MSLLLISTIVNSTEAAPTLAVLITGDSRIMTKIITRTRLLELITAPLTRFLAISWKEDEPLVFVEVPVGLAGKALFPFGEERPLPGL